MTCAGVLPSFCAVQVREGLVKGLEQAGDTRLPRVMLSRTLKGALQVFPLDCAGELQQQECNQPPLRTADCAQQSSRARGRRSAELPWASPLPWGVTCLVCSSLDAEAREGLAQPSDTVSEGHNRQYGEDAAQSTYAARLLAHPRGNSPGLLEHVMTCLHKQRESGEARSAKVLIAIGPEGGWREGELDMLCSLGGFMCVHLGERILATTTALISAVGAVQAAQQAMQGRIPRAADQKSQAADLEPQNM